MSYGPIRVLEVGGTPRERGRVHGATYAEEIRQYTADRVNRTVTDPGWSLTQLTDLMNECLPSHEAYAPDLYEEMVALAEAAGISPAEALVVGGYTDVIDVVAARGGSSPTEDTCTAVVVPDHLADGAGFLAQTWDMHSSATPYVLMLKVAAGEHPGALVYTTVGCIGQIGMNDAGIAVGINNLTAADGKVGVTWPFVVRKVLQQTVIDEALTVVLDADLAGAHNFLLFDRTGRGYSVEAMPTARHVFELGAGPLVHTNHCLADGTRRVEGVRPRELQMSSEDRLIHAGELLSGGPMTTQTLIDLTRDERSICRHPEPPFDYESCGAAILRPRTGELWACWGVPSESEYERFELELTEEATAGG